MHFVVDTNILVKEGFGASAHLSTLLSASTAVGYKVCIPKLVLEETAAKYAGDLLRDEQEVVKKIAALSRLLGRRLESPVDGLDIRAETELFRKRLSTQLSRADAVVLEYPETPHEELVQRAISRNKPFNEHGSGYRDALIWQTVLELATRVEGNIVLVSQDKGFQDAQGRLHGDLTKDLESLGLPKDRVTLATSVGDLVDEHILPNLGTTPWSDDIKILGQLGLNFEDSIGLMIQEACSRKQWDASELGIPWEYESPTLATVEDVSNLKVVAVRELPHEQSLIKIETHIEGEFDVFIYKLDFYVSDDDPRLRVNEFDWSDHYVLAGITLPLDCQLDLVVDTSNPDQHEVRNVSVELRSTDS